MPRKRLDRNITKARQLRRTMSLPEVLLWNLLRKNPDEVHFRRQHPIGDFVVDFYCATAKICIEIDGIAHDMGDHPVCDDRRDAWLESQGLTVIRISAADALERDEIRFAHILS